MEEENKNCVLVVGNLAEGFKFVGPFDSFDAAATYDELHYGGVGWVAELILADETESDETESDESSDEE
jgi:hypothetical protein